MQITIYSANCVGKAANCIYPNKSIVDDVKKMELVVANDHVCATYKGNRRSNDNFIASDVIPMDIDNDHSDDLADWITEEKMEDLFGSIDYILVPSRHHMLPKDGKSERPRYHAYFPIEKCTDATGYVAMKTAIQKAYPFFDENALDAARFLFGATTDEIVWHEGWMSIMDDIEIEEPSEEDDDFGSGTISGTITKGSRNKTLSLFAGKILVKYGDCDKSHDIYMEQAAKCDPPLASKEIATIWASALRFFRSKVSGSSGYVPPDEYNDDFGGDAGSLKPDDYSDVGQAKVLAREYGNELKYTAATDYIRFDGDVWVEDKQMAVGACVEFLDLQLQDAKDCIEVAMKALVDAGYDEVLVKQGSKALSKEIQSDHLSLFYMLVGAEKYLAFAMKRRDYKYISSALNVAKSTFWNTVARVLGTYAGKISSDILTMGNKINAQPEMAELKGRRLIIASEMQEGVRLNTAMVKQLCSTDEIQACKKYKDPFHFVPSHQVVLYTNHLPKVGANDDGIWRRLKVIPFNAKIKGNSDIKNYADYLYENAAPSIMKWIIEGAEKVSKSDHKVNDPTLI